MDFTTWMNTRLSSVVDELEQGLRGTNEIVYEDGLDLAGRNDIYEILDDILAALFPGSYSRERITYESVNFFLADLLRHFSCSIIVHIIGSQRIRNLINYLLPDTNKVSCKALNFYPQPPRFAVPLRLCRLYRPLRRYAVPVDVCYSRYPSSLEKPEIISSISQRWAILDLN